MFFRNALAHLVPSFNPCFDGSVARGPAVLCGGRRDRSFNPCFDGSVARGLDPLIQGDFLHRLFQSLF